MRLTDTGVSYEPARDRMSRIRIINIIYRLCVRDAQYEWSDVEIAVHRGRGREIESEPALLSRVARRDARVLDFRSTRRRKSRRSKGLVIIKNVRNSFWTKLDFKSHRFVNLHASYFAWSMNFNKNNLLYFFLILENILLIVYV